MLVVQDQVERAVDLQRRSYQLLLWLEDALEKGFIGPEAAVSFTTMEQSSLNWMRQHYLNLPDAARPTREDLGEFSKLFSTYLTNTFDLDVEPADQLYSPDAHCYCPLCSWMVRGRHLRPKRPSNADKERAKRMKRACLQELASACGVAVSADEVERVLKDPAYREAVGLVAYARDLLSRLNGTSVGPASLVLWRSFAWTAQGSPKKKFTLSSQLIMDAQEILIRQLSVAEGALPGRDAADGAESELGRT